MTIEFLAAVRIGRLEKNLCSIIELSRTKDRRKYRSTISRRASCPVHGNMQKVTGYLPFGGHAGSSILDKWPIRE